MRIVYYDESGDDGFPKYSSPLFCLTAIYMHYLSWKDNYETILNFRRNLKSDFNFPVKVELHTKHFLLDKNPYRELNYSNEDKKQIISLFCQLIAVLDLKVINTVIIKNRLKKVDFDVLDTSLTYSITRIDNDLDSSSNPNDRFMIITDQGRVGKMRSTTRRIQRINYIPSKFSGAPYRKEIKRLIEDPLPKDSKESYFIQLADLIAYIINLYSLINFKIADLSNRLKLYANFEDIIGWMNMLKPSFNLKASTSNEYGIVYHPK
jgi:hypothetical protein